MSNIGSLIFLLIIIGLTILLLWFFIFKVKHLKTPDVYMVDGGVKVGKSLVAVKLAVTQYRKNMIRYYIGSFFINLINKFRKLRKKPLKRSLEKPMLYSNMPLYKVKYNAFTLDILELKVRCPHKSVFLLDEASLIADSMTAYGQTKSEKEWIDYVNEKLTMFLKVGVSHGHHGSFCVYNSQNVVDLHFAFRRCTSTYLFISKRRSFPFFCLMDVRELVHDESRDVQNVYTKDVDVDNKPLFVSKKWYKYYDRYYLDCLFKDLPLYVDYSVKAVHPINRQQLKEVVTLGRYNLLRDYNESQKKVIKDEKK